MHQEKTVIPTSHLTQQITVLIMLDYTNYSCMFWTPENDSPAPSGACTLL